jgi:hypothetical protein
LEIGGEFFWQSQQWSNLVEGCSTAAFLRCRAVSADLSVVGSLTMPQT